MREQSPKLRAVQPIEALLLRAKRMRDARSSGVSGMSEK
jgi:hypothetical protein